MRIVYPYNEVLPKKTAHDVYLVRNCVSLAHAGSHTELLCGWGGLTGQALYDHYEVKPVPEFSLKQLPIIRRLSPLKVSINQVFFLFAQRHIATVRPQVVMTSVFKQGAYHVKRKQPGTKYVFEVHQLGWYPNQELGTNSPAVAFERATLSQMDLVTVTTQALKRILLQPPYSLKVPVEVVPLAVDVTPLPPALHSEPFTFVYVGQLYKSQGVELLLRALALTRDSRLEIIGGTEAELSLLKHLATQLNIGHRVVWHGFTKPANIPFLACHAHAFVAPFLSTERMPFVAHTKLLEYASWGRPIIAPNLPVVREHGQHIHLFEPDSLESLAACLQQVAATRPIAVTTVDYSWSRRAADYQQLLSDLARR